MSGLKRVYNEVIDYVTEITNPTPYEEWVRKNTKIGGAPFSVAKYPFQKAILNDMHNNMDVIKCSQVGLPLALTTKVFSNLGWRELGEINIGDYVYTPKGKLTKVLYLSPIEYSSPCYKITFCDGTEIVADEKHRWFVHSDKAFNLTGLYTKQGRIPLGSDYATKGRITTKAIFENYKGKGSRGKINIFYIPCVKPIETEGLDLPVDPYYIGLWLGNGSRSSGFITTNFNYADETIKVFKDKGFEVSKYNDHNRLSNCVDLKVYKSGVNTFKYLKELIDPTREKYFPRELLLCSVEQRFEILQGLIDSDGNISNKGRIEFYNTSKDLTEGFFELAASLGFKPRLRERLMGLEGKKSTMKNGKVIHSKKDLYCCNFMGYSNTKLSKLTFKQNNLKDLGNGTRESESFQRRIVNVEPVESVPVRCIMVDDEEHQFVCSKAFITTSNTEIQVRKALAMAQRNPNRNIIFTLPSEDMRDRLVSTRVKPILQQNPIFNEYMTRDTVRSVEITQVNTSFVLWLPATEKSATSQTADVVFNDEVDLSSQKMLALFNSRMQASDWKMSQRFSTPTYVGYGIDQSFKLSDQHVYMYKCPHCNKYMHPEFTPEFIHFPNFPFHETDDFTQLEPDWIDKYFLDFSQSYVKCKFCHKRADLGNAALREWVATFPNRKHHRGYQVTPFATQLLNPEYIFNQLLKYKKDDFIRGWYNTVLGKAYEGGSERLSAADLNPLFTGRTDLEPYDPNFEYFIGADVGTICYITICKTHSDTNNETKFILFESVKQGELKGRLKYLRTLYNIASGNMDKYPEQTLASAIRDETDGIILPVRYINTTGVNIVEYKENDLKQVDYCTVQRTWHFDEFVKDIRAGAVSFSGYGNFKESIINHFRDMIRVDKPESVPIWEKLTGTDHYFHAAGYAYRAKRRYYGETTSGEERVSLIFGGLGVNLYNTNDTLFGGKRRW